MRYLLTIGGLVGAVTVAFVMACAPRQEPLNIAVNPYLGFQPLFVASAVPPCNGCPDSSSYIGGKPFTANLVPSMHVVNRLFYAGELDAAFMSLEEALELNAHTQGGVCIAKVLGPGTGTRAIMMRAGEQRQPASLGYEQSPFNAFLLNEAMSALHWKSSHTNFHFISLKKQPQALLSGEVDAVLAIEPYLSQLKASGAVVIFDDELLSAETYDVFVVSKQAYRAHEQLVNWLATDYWNNGVSALNSHSASVVRAVETNTGLSELNVADAVQNVPYLASQQPSLAQPKLSDLIAEAIQRTTQIQPALALRSCEDMVGL